MSSNNRILTKWEPDYSEPDNMKQTSIWRAQVIPTGLRNDDVWSGSGTLIDEKKAKEALAAEKKANRKKTLGMIAVAAATAALAGAAIHEWEKHREAKQKDSKEEKETQHMPGEFSDSHHHQSSGSK
ncbi:uncharacterized protein FA14DRAFT_153634 [Meira miltonrushii]|uniref:DUF3824 domain-containing protein n=1 Tax=Meira miltonrushii TaxID=1280837 RepID=A0A316VMK2_9BASI|nr:uncharacterized protein FA14DRAFT_153634 [Meira miltonrushii]PWN38308.1 hypothetical protein FA14DRAFT_153634 [Meira miltonrushii]